MLAQRVRSLYQAQFGHQPGKTTCQLFDEKLAIFLENAITPPEQLLVDSGRRELVRQIRANLDDIIQPHLKALIEEITRVSVSDLLTAAQLDTGRIGIMAVLTERPQLYQDDLDPSDTPLVDEPAGANESSAV
jgi:uncharacterized protein YbcI